MHLPHLLYLIVKRLEKYGIITSIYCHNFNLWLLLNEFFRFQVDYIVTVKADSLITKFVVKNKNGM